MDCQNVAKTQNEMKNTAEKNFTYFAPTNVHARVHPELEPSRLLTVAAYHNAIVPCDSHIFLTLHTSEGNTLHNVFGEDQIYNDNREYGERDHDVHLPHIELQPVCRTKLRDQDWEGFLLVIV